MPGLGDEFRAAREARHLALSDVSDQIHIRSIYLQSIEEEDWSAIAAPVYVRGFIRTYARFLGLDPEAAVQAYNADLEATERESDGPVRVAPARRGPSVWVWVAAAAAIVLLVFVAYSYYQLQTSGTVAVVPTPGLATDAASSSAPGEGSSSPAAEGSGTSAASGTNVATSSATAGASASASAGTTTASAAPTGSLGPSAGSPKPVIAPVGPRSGVSPKPHASPSAAEAATPASSPGDLVTTPSPSPTPGPKTSSLEVIVSGRAWVRVDVDGKTKLEGIYPPGTRKTFEGRTAYVRTGNAGGVELVVNGKTLGKMGPGGAVVEKTYALGEQ
jgi:cytoskeleton protein RodZ